ncbi:ergot alkaloid biosynthesis protein [Saccharopolyspora karakumensis]|uniref:Ergot alkaloid biosynthesis protein n=1 Tax=Saccharopolyspora karakumensis TaxID=2530386 RepID=A0A4R5BVS7_9PSEU|nr:NAD(P)H-binding protein [Saccharopolyspora karakumensis]TDD91258.1 ergot alkaloid biosynthesis protein [Saccharopolyspora karakumensis]
MTVLVTGGTGKTGSALVELLRADDVPVRVASRNPVIGDPSSIRFDWHDPATHAPALRGVDSVFLVAPVNSVDPMPLVAPFLAEAKRLGVTRVVLLGSAIVLPNAPSALEMADAVRAQPGWVVLRASAFMQNFLSPHPVGERIRRHGEIRTAAGDGRVGWIDAHDIAAAAFALLRPGAERAGQSDYLLTGPKALSYRDAAAIITARTGREVRVLEIGTDEQVAHYRASGVSEEFASSIAAVEDGIRDGRDDQVSTAVLDLTGRPPRSFEEFADVHAAAWSDA